MMQENSGQKFVKIPAIAITLVICFIFLTGTAWGQEMSDVSNKTDKLWGIGTSITYPINEIYMIQLTYSAWEFGDILGGAAFQNWKNDQGRANAYTLLLGYRQYVWGGFHLEVELWPAYNPYHSSVDGNTYSGVELWISTRIGYKFDFELAGNDFYILAQPSFGFGVARDNPWPDKEKESNGVFEPQLIFGIRF